MPRRALLPLLIAVLALAACVRITTTAGAAAFPTGAFGAHSPSVLLAEAALAEGATDTSASSSSSVFSNSFGRSVALQTTEAVVILGEGGADGLLDALQLRFVEVVAADGALVRAAGAPVTDGAGVTSATVEYEQGGVVGLVLLTSTPAAAGSCALAISWEEVLE